MTDEWKPAQRDIEGAVSLLKGKLPQALEVASKRPDVKDLYAASSLADALYFCLPVLPPEVAALARQHYQLIQDAYHIEEEYSPRCLVHLFIIVNNPPCSASIQPRKTPKNIPVLSETIHFISPMHRPILGCLVPLFFVKPLAMRRDRNTTLEERTSAMPHQPRKKTIHGGGSVYQRKSDGRYVAKYKHPETGKLILRYAGTEKEAEKELDDIKYEIRRGTVATGPNQKVKDYIVQWLEDVHKPEINLNTYTKHRSIVYRHIIPALGHIELKKLTPQQVQKFYTDTERVGLKKSSVRDIHKVLRNALNNATRWGIVSQNVCDKVTKPHPAKSQHTMLSVEQIRQLLQAAKSYVGMEAFIKLGAWHDE